MFKKYKDIVVASDNCDPNETKTLGFEEPPPAASYDEPPQAVKGTIEPFDEDDEDHREEDSKSMRDAMKGLGTDELTLIQILTKYNNEQRQKLAKTYKTLFGRDLLDDMIKETSRSFQTTIKALMMPSRLYDASSIHHAMDGCGTDEITIIDILCPRSNEEIKMIREGYAELYQSRDMEKDLISETSGDFKRLLVSIVQGNRESGDSVDQAKVKQDAKDLYKAGEGKIGTDEEVFNRILALRSWPHIKALSDVYRKDYGMTLSSSIKSEFSGDIKAGLLAIVCYAENPVKHFAGRMANIKGSDDSSIRFMVSHSETDLHDIKQCYHQTYKKSLEYAISKEESGDFRKLLIKILNPKLDNEKLHAMCK